MDKKLLHVSSSPHFREPTTTTTIMLDVCIALIPTSVFGIYQFGWHSFWIILVTVASCVLSEYLYEVIMKKPVTIGDLSAVVTGMILALNMPPEIPLWVPALGGVFAIIVVKQLYGGIGQNFMNPALAARAFLLISFAAMMTDFSSSRVAIDSVSGATVLSTLKNHESVDLMRLIIGNIPGTIGETSKIALGLGAAYLLYRKVITWRVPCVYIATFALFALIYSGFDFYWTVCEVFAGGLFFGAFFMANDYVTHPVTMTGHYIYAVFLGIITGIFRFFGGSLEGVSYAILLGNIVTPLIEKITLPKAFGKEGNDV